MAIDVPKKRIMPKGGRKGGAIFPRLALKEALEYSSTLVSKSHVSALTLEEVYAGVLKAKHGLAATKMSALKQFGLLDGSQEDGFKATELAKKLVSATDEDKPSLIQLSCVKPKVFSSLFSTFHSDTVTKSRLRSRASELKVHPDEVDKCVDLFLKSMELAGLVTITGDQIKFGVPGAKSESDSGYAEVAREVADNPQLNGVEEHNPDEVKRPALPQSDVAGESLQERKGNPAAQQISPKPRVIINVDSTMDPSKLEKQLEILKRFGAL